MAETLTLEYEADIVVLKEDDSILYGTSISLTAQTDKGAVKEARNNAFNHVWNAPFRKDLAKKIVITKISVIEIRKIERDISLQEEIPIIGN